MTRFVALRFMVAMCIAAFGFVPANAAHASPSSDRVASTTQAIEAAAQRWFAAQADAARIDTAIADIEHQIATAQASVERTGRIATARAVVMYKGSDIALSSMFGDNALDSARRAHLVNDANAGGDAAIAELTAVVDDLHAQQRALQEQRTEQQKVLRQVASERASLDADLASARASARLSTAADSAARAQRSAVARTVHPSAPVAARTPDEVAPPTGPALAVAVTSVAISSRANAGRVSSHHSDSFLTCTRAREAAGRYDAVSPSGYYGAYQFLPSTWDASAVHAGRFDVVGLLPSRASQFNQDEIAWALYQWQGKSPWGGRC